MAFPKDTTEGLTLFMGRMVAEGRWPQWKSEIGKLKASRNPAQAWWQQEHALAQSLGYIGYDDEMSKWNVRVAERQPEEKKVDRLAELQEAFDKSDREKLTRDAFSTPGAFLWYQRFQDDPKETMRQVGQFLVAPAVKARATVERTADELESEQESKAQVDEALEYLQARKNASLS